MVKFPRKLSGIKSKVNNLSTVAARVLEPARVYRSEETWVHMRGHLNSGR